ncbi:MAG TPA: Ig-like domain-containing protein [Thermoanaerobaculia bacterium]|nr:Ig-like domain-containing protein [Thermoanaerobaculia bacterium]
MRILLRTLVALCLSVCLCTSAIAAEYDDCDANFIAPIGASAYQFSPGHGGELGTVRLFAILSYQRAAHEGRFGTAFWQLRIDHVEDGTRVLTVDGRAHIGRDGAALAELWWDGRDDTGQLVPAGRYHYSFVARYAGARRRALSYDEAFDGEEALASTDEVIVNYDLTPDESHGLRVGTHATSCQIQQNAPLEAGFPYNFYYGSTHAHSNWSDGGYPTSACASGNTYGSGTFTPANVFAFARDEAGLDFWVVNEHNHLIQDAIATNNGPVTEAKVRQRYQDGLAAAVAASSSSFVALYGMEWGVSTNSDQGHVTLIETPALLGWETCTSCNGPSAECTPGTNCYFDVFTPKRFGYLSLYAASVAHPSPAGALGIFNHPDSGNFDNFAFNANANDAIQGIAVRSGLAFSTATNCANTNVGSTDYTARWKEALNRGFHVGPIADHDSHCNNYGVALPTRTVYLAPSLSRSAIMAAHRARRFYATEDPNAQLVFRTLDGSRVMGAEFTSAGGATLVANLYDPDGESTTTLEIWRGQIGGGVPAAPYATWSNTSTATLTETLTSGTYWYYVHAVQADGHDTWSAPMWITYQSGGSGDTQAPSTSITAPLAGVTLSGTTLVTASATDNIGVARVEFLVDGSLQSTDHSAPYEWSWNTAATANGTHALQSRAFDAANNSTASASVSVTVSNSGGGTGANVGGWTLTQANSAATYTIPAGTTIPAEGYLVIARQSDKAAFESYWARTLPANAIFLNSAGAMPVINGDETYTLANASAVTIDGPSAAQPASAARTLQRVDPCGTSWNSLTETSANPGSGAGAGCGGGVKLNEISDASGTGNFVYEYVELHNDSGAAGDTQAPAVSITAPAAGSPVSATVNVTANATDNVGVTKVEFLLDGVLQSTDTLSPYAWSWNTATATNATHSLTAKAYDAANNVTTSSAVSVTVANGTPINIGGYKVVQANAALTYTIPTGTIIPSRGYVIIGRNATKAQFQTFWGVTLAANVVYLNGADLMPQINGSETYTLRNASNVTLDGATIAMASAGGESIRRLNACGAAGTASSWTRGATTTANPGTGAPAPCNKGVFLSEFSDALGTGNFIYEFVELSNDR